MAGTKEYHTPAMDQLFQAFLSLSTEEDCRRFFTDLCSEKEILALVQRLETARLLLQDHTYGEITQSIDISTATISRVNRCVQYGTGGYSRILRRAERRMAVRGSRSKRK